MNAFSRSALAASFVLCSAVLQLSAQATRTWVSGVGDDVNPCSRTAPCKTFAGAISKTAAGGEIDALDSGGFGAVTITKSITIDGGGVLAGILATGTNGIVISAGNTDSVVLRNLQINGAGTVAGTDTRGIKFLSGLRLVVENCDISNMGKRGISIESSTPGAGATIINSSIHGNMNNGIVILPPTGVINHLVLDRVRSVNNAVSGFGSSNGGFTHIRDSDFSNNGASGMLADGSTVDVSGTSIIGNANGITSQNGATVRIGSSTLTGNTTGFATATGGIIASYGDNQFAGAGVGLSVVSKQ